MILGFTGTRNTPSVEQVSWLGDWLSDYRWSELHHGCCVGADALAHGQAVLRGLPIHAHPPINTKLVEPDTLCGCAKVYRQKDYFARNRDIANACDWLAALPDGPHRPSGTWYTVDYALSINKPVMVCYPNGIAEKIV
jgi:hypothetical protein